MDRLDPIEPTEKDAPLRYDIRLLGRILGETVRAQEGDEVFELVERIRRTGVQFHRNADETARQELQSIMSSLPTDRALSIIRAFGYFSHLANIAEDQHHIRRTRAYAKAEAPPRPGTMAYALGRARQARLSREQLQGFFDHALCSPVLTAHPTEIRRKSSIDREMEIARLLDERDRIEFTPEELAANRRALRRNVLTLWQTSLVRGTRLRVIDEVANGLSYYDYTFLHALPLFYADLERLLGATDPAWQEVQVPSFLRMGSWIGGDRDGNPFVTAEVTRQTLAMQSERAMRFYLAELHQLGGELSLDGRIVGVSEGLKALAANSPDRAVERQDEPYRRAIVGMYARLAATAWALDKLEAPHPPVGPAPAYASVDDFKADLDTIFNSLSENGAGPLARGHLRALRRAVDVFGFHLASLDLRQNSDVHERVVAELVEAGGLGDYRALDEPGRVALLVRELGNMRPLSSPHLSYGEETANELGMLDVTADAHRRYGPPVHAELRDLQGRQRLGHPGSGRAAQGGRPAAPARGPARRRHRAAVRDHRRPAALRADHGGAVRPAGLPPPARLARQRAGSDAGLFRQQQGRRLPHLDLGALQGRADPGRVCSAAMRWACACSMAAAARSAAAAGRAYDAILAQPSGAVQGQIRVTEQGEVIGGKYSNAEVGRRNLETLAAATFEATLLRSRTSGAAQAWRAIMEELSANAFRAYRALVYETEGFDTYFRESTVLEEIASLNIGSRPASRSKKQGIEDLRAIPWVFSWAQCRVMLPGWYGFGAAVKEWLAAHPDGLATLQAMHADWPFFRTALSNMDMVLSKSDMAIASRYAELVTDADARQAHLRSRAPGMAVLDRRGARHHAPADRAGDQSAAGALDPQPLSLHRSAEPCADRAAAPPSRRRHRAGGGAGHPSQHQRHRRGPA